jgi:hypothetical protein
MTQDEVDLIYDYLHENYEYKDGELIGLNNIGRRKKGEHIGYINDNNKRFGRPRMQTSIRLGMRDRTFSLSQLVYLFFNKKFCKYIMHIDYNQMNNSIENLRECTLNEYHHPKIKSFKDKGYIKTRFNKKDVYRVITSRNRGQEILRADSYNTPDEASRAYEYARTLLCDKDLTLSEIYEKLRIKFPGNVHKRYTKEIKKREKRKKRDLPQGVYLSKNILYSQVMVRGKNKYLGCFDTAEEAHQAYLKSKKELKYETTP